MKTKAYSYIRFSSKEQSDGDSLRRQTEASEKYAQEHGLELVGETRHKFIDKGVSAYRGAQAKVGNALSDFLEQINSGDIPKGSQLLVESLDRLSREEVPIAFSRFIEILNAGVDIVTLMDGKKYSKNPTMSDLMMSLVYMSTAHEESLKKSRRLKEVWGNKKRLAREEKKPLGAATPMWLDYDKENNVYVLNGKEKIVIRIFELCAGGYGKSKISKILNEEGIPAFKAGMGSFKGVWQQSSIDKILRSRSVLGEYQPYQRVINEESGAKKGEEDGAVIKGYYPSIVTEELFNSARLAITQRRKTVQTNTGNNFANIFQGLARCESCKSPMNLVNKGSGKKGGKYLVCSRAKVGGGCKYHSYRLEVAENVFLQALMKLPTLSLIDQDTKKWVAEATALENDISRKNDLIEKLMDLVLQNPSSALAKQIQESESEIIQKKIKLEEINGKIYQGYIVRDKDSFISSIDLKSYQGRYRANKVISGLDVSFSLGFLNLSRVEQREWMISSIRHRSGLDKVGEPDIRAALDELNLEWYKVFRNEKNIMEFSIRKSGIECFLVAADTISAGLTQGEYVGDDQRFIADTYKAIIGHVGTDIEASDYATRALGYIKGIKPS